MSRLTYWQRVNLQAEIDAQNQAASSIRRVLRYYKKAFSDIEADIADIFGSMANHAGLTMEQAKETIRISKKYDIRELVELLKHTKDTDTRAAIEQLINAQAYGARIHRLEAVKANLYIHLAKAAKREIEDIRGLFGDIFKDGYYSTVYHTAKEANIGVDFSLIPERAVERAMNAPWHGKSFSARVWEHTDEVAGRAQKIVVSGLQKGTSTARMARELAEAMHTSEFYADRLIRTQTNHFLNLGTLKGYEETDVETYTYLATLDGRTCERCWPLDGKVFPVTEAAEGVNYPTIHPFCRCTTTPGSRRANTRIARDPESGESYKVDGGMDFETWYQTLPKEKREALEKYRRMDQKKSRDQKQYEAYKTALGKENVPKTLELFRDMKYNDRDGWEKLKAEYRQNHNFLQEQLSYTMPNGEKNFIPAQSIMTTVRTIAGAGSKVKVKIEDSLIEQYGGSVGEWKKRVGKIESDKYIFDVHWFELNGKQYRMKLKHRK